MDITEVLARKGPVRRTVPVVLDSEIRDELEQATDEQAFAQDRHDRRTDNPAAAADLVAANARLDAARAAARDATQKFVFEAMGREAFEALRQAHPPTKSQSGEYTKAALGRGIPPHLAGQLSHNPETFPPALIAACCIDPAMTVEQATEMWNSDDWSQAELADLFAAAQLVNTTARRAELGNS